MYMSQSIILFRRFYFILFYFIFVGCLLYKEFCKFFLEKSLCFPHVNFTNLANYWEFFNFQNFFGNVLLRGKLSNTNECD
jgi:hypothetical protein